jgi:AcrR family transcriptional regulator
MSPKVPKAYLDARRKEIIEAAYNCFSKKGFHHTTMQDIYDTAKLSPGAVYNYFSSKEEIAIAAVKELNTMTAPKLSSMAKEKPEKAFQEMNAFWLSLLKTPYIRESIGVILDYYSESTRNNPIRLAILESQSEYHQTLMEIVTKNQQAGFINPELDPLSVARAIMSLFFGLGIHLMLDPKADIEAFSRVFEALLNGTFAGVPGKSLKSGRLDNKLNYMEKKYSKRHGRS